MRLSKISLAVAGALLSSAAFAQSVQVYGLVDTGLMNLDTINSSSTTSMESGMLATSRWGIKGSEDLGSGLKVEFLFEQGFNSDTGQAGTAGSTFGRESWVALTGGWGSLRLGKMWNAYDQVSAGAQGALVNSAFVAQSYNTRLGGANTSLGVFAEQIYNANPNNTLMYISPAIGGLTFFGSYSLDESNTSNAGRVSSFALAYADGPVTVNFGYQIESDLGGLTNDWKTWNLNGSYDFGAVKLGATYARSKFDSGEGARDIGLVLDVPLSDATVISASYARSKDRGYGAGANEERSGYGLAVLHNMSKRTAVYAGLFDGKADISGVATADTRLIGAGLRHSF